MRTCPLVYAAAWLPAVRLARQWARETGRDPAAAVAVVEDWLTEYRRTEAGTAVERWQATSLMLALHINPAVRDAVVAAAKQLIREDAP